MLVASRSLRMLRQLLSLALVREAVRLGQEAQDAEDSERAAAGAMRHGLTLVQPSPPVLSEEAPRGVDPARRWRRGRSGLRRRTLVCR